jgi:hypothetical protein
MKFSTLVFFLFALSGVINGKDSNTEGNQRALYNFSKQIEIDENLIELKQGVLYFQFNLNQSFETLKSFNSKWIEKYSKSHFIAYLVNMTDSSVYIKTQDGSLLIIQEALDENNNWQPIEYWIPSGCGNSYFNPLSLEAGKCVLVPIKRYDGNYKTKFRLKFNTGKRIIYSDIFEGTLNKSQFEKLNDDVNGILYDGPASYFEYK